MATELTIEYGSTQQYSKNGILNDVLLPEKIAVSMTAEEQSLQEMTEEQSLQKLHEILGGLEGASSALLQSANGSNRADETKYFVKNLGRWRKVEMRLSEFIDRGPAVGADAVGKAEEIVEELTLLIDDLRKVRDVSAADKKRINARVEHIRRSAAEITIRDRVIRQLKDVPFGMFIDFKESYGGEFADEQGRVRMLRHLDNSSAGMPAVIDVNRERIYKKSPNVWLQLLSYVAPAIAWGIGLALLFGVSRIGGLPANWNLTAAGSFRHSLLPAFGFLTVGVIAHLLVENVKQGQIGIAPVLPLNHTLDWLHLRCVGLIQTVAIATIAVIGLHIAGMNMDLTATATSGDTQILNWIAAGFALDSVAGILLVRFSGFAGKQVETVTNTLSIASEAK